MSANASVGEFRQVRTDEIVLSGTNPRRHFDEVTLRELGESVRTVGVLQPLVVRRVEGVTGFVLVAGERRWRAATWANLATVPVVVRELTDLEALEVQVLENLQRQDIRPLEEAEGFRRLIDSGAYTAATLADRLGKSRSHVFGRLRLLKLLPEVQEAVTAGKIEASVGDLLSKFAPEVQVEALQEVMPRAWSNGEPVPVRECKRILEGFWPDLGEAPWLGKELTEKVALEGHPACAGCAYRSANMPDMEETGDRCMNRVCYRAKREAYRETVRAGLEAKGRKVLPAAEASGLFEEHARAPQLRHGAGYVLASDRCWDAKDGAKWRDLVKGSEVAGVWLVSPEGKAVEAFPAKEAREAAAAAGKLGSGAGPAGDRAATIAKNRREREVNSRIGEACMAAVAKLGEGEFLRVLLEERCPGWREYLEGLGQDPDKAEVGRLRAAAVRVLCWSKSQGWQQWSLKNWEALAGVDREKIERQVGAEEEAGGRRKAKAKGKKGGAR